MSLMTLTCPSCGANLDAPDDRDTFFCSYCGAKVIQEKQHIELSGEVTVSGMASAQSLLERAFMFIEDRNYRSGDEYIERVLDIKPKCAKAYIGKLLCELRLPSVDKLSERMEDLTRYDYYNKAVSFAEGEEKSQYLVINASIIDSFNAIRREKQDEIQSVMQNIGELKKYLEVNKTQYIKRTAKKVIWALLLTVSIILTVFFTIGVFALWPMIFFDAPCVVWMIFMIRLVRRNKMLTAEYDETKLRLEQQTIELASRQADYDAWAFSKCQMGLE